MDLTEIQPNVKSNCYQSCTELVFRSYNNTPDEPNGVINVISCYKKAVEYCHASFVVAVCQLLREFVGC